MLMAIVFGMGVFLKDPQGPTKGPQVEQLQLNFGKYSVGNKVMHKFNFSCDDTVKHGNYYVYFEGGPERFYIEFRQGKRHGLLAK